MEDTVVRGRNVLERWSSNRGLKVEGSIRPNGRGKYSPPVNPEGITSQGIEAKKQRSHLPKYFFPIQSSNYKNMLIKTQETGLFIVDTNRLDN